jgi:hypothetical protein
MKYGICSPTFRRTYWPLLQGRNVSQASSQQEANSNQKHFSEMSVTLYRTVCCYILEHITLHIHRSEKKIQHGICYIMLSFLLFQLQEERWKALTSVPRSTPDAAWDGHLLDWIRHQAWWGATSAFCRNGSYLVPIPTARCNSNDCTVRHSCVSGSVRHLQENHFYLYRKQIEETKIQLRKK